jgi:maltooligosyltrehalose trehalohydrolase
LAGHQFVICTQNHDQVGNRALGARTSALMSTGRLKVAAALLLTGPFTPMLFQGEEWAAGSPFQYFTNHCDPQLAAAVSEGRRREFAAFGWRPDAVPDPQDPDTFARSKLDWDEVERSPHGDVLDWYRRLIQLRRSHPALSDPRLNRIRVDADEASGTIVVARPRISILVNLGPEHHRFPTESGDTVLAVSDARTEVQEGGLLVPPDAVALIETAA